jgi:RES domain-containing protein
MPAFKSADAYLRFAKKVSRYQRYIRDDEDRDFLEALLLQARAGRRTKVLQQSILLWRAQLGHGWEALLEGDEQIGDVECGFAPERMKPLRDRAREGRANPKGIPYLYLSNDKDTALAEVRPWLQSLVSLAQFRTLRELVIVDCSTDQRPKRRLSTAEPFVIVRPEEWDMAVWYDVGHSFSTPIAVDDDVASYAATQILAEFFRAKGFDGVVYESAFGKGHNLALFDPDAAELVNCSLYKLSKVAFEFEQAGNTYFVNRAYA